MSVDLGDRTEDSTIYFAWSTNAADGSSITRAVNGTISVYKNDSVTQSVAGITDTEDFDSLTGIHSCKIDTSADVFYAASADYTVVLSGATIDGKSVNAVLAVFSIENRFPSAAAINTEVTDVLKIDTISEPSQAAPPATPTFEDMIAYIYFMMRNKIETTASETALYDNAGTTKLIKSQISDDGTTFTKEEYISGA